jgi:hypothetical protein
MAIGLLGSATVMAGAEMFAKLAQQLGLAFAAGKGRLPSCNFVKVSDVAGTLHVSPPMSYANQDHSNRSERNIFIYTWVGEILQHSFRPFRSQNH